MAASTCDHTNVRTTAIYAKLTDPKKRQATQAIRLNLPDKPSIDNENKKDNA